MDTVVVKKLYSDKFLLEQSSDVGLVKEKFLSTFADFVFWMTQKQLSKNEKFHGNEALLF